MPDPDAVEEERPRPGRRWAWAPALVLVASLLLTLLGTLAVSLAVQAKDRQRFDNAARLLHIRIEERVETCVALLRGAAGLLAVEPRIDLGDFRAYVRQLDLATQYPGIRGIGWTVRIRDGELDALRERMEQEGAAGFRVWPEDPPRRELHAIVYLEPLDTLNQRAIGYDMHSEPVRADAMDRARDGGYPVASGKVRLVQEEGEARPQAGFLIYHPVYETDAVPATVEERRAQLRGFVYSPFRAGDLFAGLLPAGGAETVSYEVYAADGPAPEALLRGEPDAVRQREEGYRPRFQKILPLDVAGQRWTLAFATRPDFELSSGRALVPWTAAVGLLISLVLYGTTLGLARARLRAEGSAARLRESQAVLRGERERFLTTLASTADAVVATDTAGAIDFVSRSAQVLTGWSHEDAVGQPLDRVVKLRDPRFGALGMSPVERVLQEQRPIELPEGLLLDRALGPSVPVEASGAPIRGSDSGVTGVVLVLRDISERLQRREELREQARVLEILNRVALSFGGELDPDRLVQRATEAAREASGAAFGAFFYNVTDEDGAKYMLFELVGAERADFERFGMPRATELFGPTFRGEAVVRSADVTQDPRYGRNPPHGGMPQGHLPVRSYLAVPVVSSRGDVIGGLFLGHPEPGVFQESHERLVSGIAAQVAVAIDAARLHQASVESEERYRFLADSMPQNVWTGRPDGTTEYYNGRWIDYAGADVVRSSPLAGWDRALHPDDVQTAAEAWRAAVAEGSAFQCEYRLRRASDGAYRWHLGRAFPQKDREGRVLRWFGTATDIDDQKRANQALERQAADLARSNAELQQFAYVASHDLQEPLRMVVTFTQLLQRRYAGQLGPDADEIIRYAVEGGQRMQSLIRDLLEFSRVGTSAQPLQPVDASEALEEALEALRMTLRERRAEIEREELPRVLADRRQLTQVFQNLISNAVRFCDREVPRVRVGARPEGDTVAFAVEDNGIGITPGYSEKVFQMFQRLHPRDRYPGSGIGLAICRKIVERHGGRIWFESRPGEGTTFFFTLPQA